MTENAACNVGGADRVLRIAVGLAILAVGAYFRSWWGLVGLAPLLTGLFRCCPAYIPLGWSTAAKK